jgi:hypothetical protein
MGLGRSCCRNSVQDDIEDQYQTLVVSRPSPVDHDGIELFANSEDTDVPEFAEVLSDSDGKFARSEAVQQKSVSKSSYGRGTKSQHEHS